MTTYLVDVPQYFGDYAALQTGEIWSRAKGWGLNRWHNGQYLKWFYRGQKGQRYAVVEIEGKTVSVHRLIAETFIPNPHNLPCVNHIDGNRLNNAAMNLEWCTQKENMQHAQKLSLQKYLYGEQNPTHKLTSKQVMEIRHKKAQGLTLKQLATEYESSISNISYIVRGETRKHG